VKINITSTVTAPKSSR